MKGYLFGAEERPLDDPSYAEYLALHNTRPLKQDAVTLSWGSGAGRRELGFQKGVDTTSVRVIVSSGGTQFQSEQKTNSGDTTVSEGDVAGQNTASGAKAKRIRRG
jgi:hypothetical protein